MPLFPQHKSGHAAPNRRTMRDGEATSSKRRERMRTYLCVLIIGLSLVCAVWPIITKAAEPLLTEEIVLDGQTYSRKQLLLAFLDAVFTKDTLNENERGDLYLSNPGYPDGETGFYSPEYLKEKYPWLYPHIYPDAAPRLLAINKWTKPIRISLGMPNNLKTFGPYKDGQKREFAIFSLYPTEKNTEISDSNNYAQLKEKISKLSILLEKQTNIDIKIILPNSETIQNYGNVRIVFVDKSHFDDSEFRNPATPHIFGVGQFIPRNFRSFEHNIATGFKFASGAKKQVDGYFLTNSKNEIEMAFCYIWHGHEQSTLNALLHECLVRSLGFSGAVAVRGYKSAPESILTLWNEPEEWPKKHKDKATPPENLSEFDQFMIRTLYNPALRPGMDYLQAQRILMGLE